MTDPTDIASLIERIRELEADKAGDWFKTHAQWRKRAEKAEAERNAADELLRASDELLNAAKRKLAEAEAELAAKEAATIERCAEIADKCWALEVASQIRALAKPT